MNTSLARRIPRLGCVAVAVAATALVACQKRSTTVETPNGSVTTTVLEPTPEARQQMGQAASATSSALDRAGDAAASAADRIGAAASGAVDRVRESARSGTLAHVGDAAGDAALTAKVKAALLVDKDVKGLQIDVDTHDGAVTLTGAAETQPNLDRAADIARRIDGVKSVENRMTVKKSG